jgi:hypothetical protein
MNKILYNKLIILLTSKLLQTNTLFDSMPIVMVSLQSQIRRSIRMKVKGLTGDTKARAQLASCSSLLA